MDNNLSILIMILLYYQGSNKKLLKNKIKSIDNSKCKYPYENMRDMKKLNDKYKNIKKNSENIRSNKEKYKQTDIIDRAKNNKSNGNKDKQYEKSYDKKIVFKDREIVDIKTKSKKVPKAITKNYTNINKLKLNFIKDLNIKNKESLSKQSEDIVKVPVLVTEFNIKELFTIEVGFNNNNIIEILSTSNELKIKHVYLNINKSNGYKGGTVMYEGVLKTTIHYLSPTYVEKSCLGGVPKYHVVFTKFNGCQKVNINKYTVENQNYLKNIIVNMTKSEFSVQSMVCKPKHINEYVDFYNEAKLLISSNCKIEIYREKLVKLNDKGVKKK
ncbi:hypothetical protein [Hathewaya limosa]|uniref:Uncharacterized protein n=1 Tax=Hathewaya limosa TaxID=1536 RepID=A0ABU0JW34_HATLI|nr:hypothetical protein [Hathewaya limosa]MDQ0480446.1 hypothetical protein [Hathewaya limosa]